MIGHLLDGVAPEVAVRSAGRLKADRDELRASLDHELTEIHVFVAQTIRAHIDNMERTLSALEEKLLTELQSFEPFIQLLLTVPGMDRLGIAKLLVEIGPEMPLFGNPGRLAAWCGLCPGNNESAGKRKKSKTRSGNPYVRAVLIEMANAAVKTCCYFREKHQSLVVRKGYKKSIVAIAHKMIRLVYLMLTRQVPYRDKSTDFEALRIKRKAPRWVKALEKYGLLQTPSETF